MNESGVGSVFEDDGGENHKRDDEDDRRDDEDYGYDDDEAVRWQNWGVV